jgi:diguanylate cyclase (GGDEF)-like protein
VTGHAPPSRRILVVEDSRAVSGFLCRRIEESLHFEPVAVYSLSQARSVLERDAGFFVAVLDLNLPDAPNGEIVDYVIGKKIPSIILTASFDERMRKEILAKSVVDYVLKDHPGSIDHVMYLIRRIFRNQDVRILLVDDSRFFRSYCRGLLEAHKFRVLEAGNGEQGLKVLSENPDVRLIITDYNMPVMDGFTFVSGVRERFGKNEVGIIGLSAQGAGVVSARFLKTGANDFLPKPFASEEFYARVNQNIELIEFIGELREIAIRDPLTRLYNRRHYFEAGERLLKGSLEKGEPVTIAMLDIDHFKSVNDRYGHEAGDAVLVGFAENLLRAFGEGYIVSRFGGEEFSVFACGVTGERAFRVFDDFRKLVADAEVGYGGESIAVTVSIGLSFSTGPSLADMVREADRSLYRAKADGRNRVVAET